MSLSDAERALVEAQRLRDMARSIVRTDLETLRLGLSDRPVTTRVRDAVVTRAVDTAENGMALVRDNRAAIGLTMTGVIGWLFRRQLGALAQTGWARLMAWRAHQRD